MSDFRRKPDQENIFESNEMTTITLIYNEFREDRYNNNDHNSLSFQQALAVLEKNNTCYWQKNVAEEVKNKKKGYNEKRVSHRLLVQYESSKAIEIIGTFSKRAIDAFNEEFYYYIVKMKEVAFFNPPTNNAIIITTKFRVIGIKDAPESKYNNNFKELYSRIEELDVPIKEVNKEEDKKIWDSYVIALKKLVQRKEQVWKIKNVSEPYFDKTKSNRRDLFIDIEINEDDLISQFENETIKVIGKKKLEDWGVNKSGAFFELRNYTTLNSVTLEKIKANGIESFYELNEDSPKHHLRGLITFKHSDENSRTEIYESIESHLNDYKITQTINEKGKIDIDENDIKYLEKIISDNYNEILEIKKDTEICLDIKFNQREKFRELKNEIDKLLREQKQWDRFRIHLNPESNTITVEVSAFLEPYFFHSLDLKYQKSTITLKPSNVAALKFIEGIEIVNDFYVVETTSSQELNTIIERINSAYGTNLEYREFRKLPTKYHFKYSNLEQLKELKLQVDNKIGKLDISSSKVYLYPSDTNDYKRLLEELENLPFEIALEKKPFSIEYYVLFKDDIALKRQSIFNSIQNDLQESSPIEIKTEILGEYSKLLFDFQFDSDEQREEIKDILSKIHSKYSSTTILSFDNELGSTIYEFNKNVELEADKENEMVKGIRQASFIFLTEEDKSRYDKDKEIYGDDFSFRGGIDIGKFVWKNNNILKFKVDESFERLLNANEEQRIELEEIKEGYIKPIFIGELTNLNRMIGAMRKVTDPGGRSGYPANLNLPNFIFDSKEARVSDRDLISYKEIVKANLIEKNLNEKQIEAVAKAANAIDIALIQGPPGTGKTTVIAEIIWQTLNENPDAKILVTSQTNLAVDNAIERLSGKRIVRPIRIGNIDKFENEGKVYSFDRINSWMKAKNKEIEEQYSNNAIEGWIKTIENNCSVDPKYESAITKWKEKLSTKSEDIKEAFNKSYRKHINVFAATCSECGSRNFREIYQQIYGQNSDNKISIEFDVVIMDEASKATPPEMILPLTYGKKVVILGDHKQLPPMLDEKEFDEALESVGLKSLVETWTSLDYKISQFEKLFKNAPKILVGSLDVQYRMHEQIMNCVSQFYNDQEEFENGLICGIKDSMNNPDFTNKASRWHGLELDPFINHSTHAIWVNVDSPESTVGTGTSYKNDGEIEAINLVLKVLTKSNGFEEYYNSMTKEEQKEIGIITYYMPQMQEIRKSIYPDLTKAQLRDFDRHKYLNEYQLPFPNLGFS